MSVKAPGSGDPYVCEDSPICYFKCMYKCSWKWYVFSYYRSELSLKKCYDEYVFIFSLKIKFICVYYIRYPIQLTTLLKFVTNTCDDFFIIHCEQYLALCVLGNLVK